MLVDVSYYPETAISVNVQLDTLEKTVNKEMFVMLKILVFAVHVAMTQPATKDLDAFVLLDILEHAVKG